MILSYLLSLTPTSKEHFDKVIDEIVQQPKYYKLRKEYKNIYEKIQEWIQNWFNRMSERENPINPTKFDGKVVDLIVVLSIIIIVIVIVVILLMILRTLDKDKKLKYILGEEINEKTTAQSLNDKARGLKEEGNYREAIRYHFIALILQMNEKNILYHNETMTNIEMIKQLEKNNIRSLKEINDVVNIFNRVWYGHKEMNLTLYEQFNSMMIEIQREVSSIEST